mmetsp:Transcript_18018/g.32259  ORF Transcript_18018/g.32259 Transcript_18018/m.32259 type:complete len:260 (-) Transcript_18018:344-1123(-)
MHVVVVVVGGGGSGVLVAVGVVRQVKVWHGSGSSCSMGLGGGRLRCGEVEAEGHRQRCGLEPDEQVFQRLFGHRHVVDLNQHVARTQAPLSSFVLHRVHYGVHTPALMASQLDAERPFSERESQQLCSSSSCSSSCSSTDVVACWSSMYWRVCCGVIMAMLLLMLLLMLMLMLMLMLATRSSSSSSVSSVVSVSPTAVLCDGVLCDGVLCDTVLCDSTRPFGFDLAHVDSDQVFHVREVVAPERVLVDMFGHKLRKPGG